MAPTVAAAERFLSAPLLSEIEPPLRRDVLATLVERHEPAGTVLLEQGTPNDRLTFLIEGTATIQRSHPGGRIETLANLTAPAVFGETSFFRSVPPIVSVLATSDVWLLTLDRLAHQRLRRENPRAAEALALATVRVLAERFDLLDRRISEELAQYANGRKRATEWASFRARLFEEPNL